MRITIANRFRPFSHYPGTSLMLPGSYLSIHCFPTRLFIYDLSSSIPSLLTEVHFRIDGPVHEWTALQDMEKNCLVIWGNGKKGFFRYRLYSVENDPQQLTISVEKGDLTWSCTQGYILAEEQPKEKNACIPERLSLGCHKQQECDLINRRVDMAEILPFWFRLGQLIPIETTPTFEGTQFLLKKCIENKDKLTIAAQLKDLFLVGFDSFLSPRLVDENFYGFDLPSIENQSASPLTLLSEGVKVIRTLFFQQQDNHLEILPFLPPQFHSGRLLHIDCQSMGSMDIEWSKKLIRRAIFQAKEDASLNFIWQKEISRFRLRSGKKEEILSSNKIIEVRKGEVYFFDNYEK